MVHSCDQQTDTQTDHAASVARGRNFALRACDAAYKCYTNNDLDNINGAVIMTKAIAIVHPVLLTNAAQAHQQGVAGVRTPRIFTRRSWGDGSDPCILQFKCVIA